MLPDSFGVTVHALRSNCNGIGNGARGGRAGCGGAATGGRARSGRAAPRRGPPRGREPARSTPWRTFSMRCAASCPARSPVSRSNTRMVAGATNSVSSTARAGCSKSMSTPAAARSSVSRRSDARTSCRGRPADRIGYCARARSRGLRGRDRARRRRSMVPRRHRGLRRGHPRSRPAGHGRACGAQALAREWPSHAGADPDRARKLGRARRRHRRRRRRLSAEAVPHRGIAGAAALDRPPLRRPRIVGGLRRRHHAGRTTDESERARRADHAVAARISPRRLPAAPPRPRGVAARTRRKRLRPRRRSRFECAGSADRPRAQETWGPI